MIRIAEGHLERFQEGLVGITYGDVPLPQVTRHDHSGQVLCGQSLSKALPDFSAVLKDRDPTGYGEDILHIVADEQNDHSLFVKLMNQV